LPVNRKNSAGKVKNFSAEGKNSSCDLTKTGENICGVLQTRFAMPVSKPILALFALLLFVTCLTAQKDHGDCPDARILCDKSPLLLENLPGPGQDAAELPATACSEAPFPETHSAWFRWTVAEAGTLELLLTPLHEADDLDFVLFRLPALHACAERAEVCCMLSGPVLGEEAPDDAPCRGATGLVAGAALVGGGAGCPPGAGRFLPPLPVQVGESYALFVHNFRSAGGFELQFAGSCAFAAVPELCAATGLPDVGDAAAGFSLGGVVPNPASGAAQIAVQVGKPAIGALTVTDASGRLRSSTPVSLLPGENTLRLDLSALEPGAYFANLLLGKQRRSVRFVRQ
jgi:hypothetical protein